MTDSSIKKKQRQSLFLSEYFMAAACAAVVITSIVSLVFCIREGNSFTFFEVLAKLAALEINLLKLESCPLVGHDFEFLFFFEIEASVRDERVVKMLEELERSSPAFSYLGNYQED